MFSITNVVNHYKHFLNVNHPTHFKPYCSRLNNHPEGARAEAIAFHFFSAKLDGVCVEEDRIKGGVDFRCKTNSAEFMVEVTSLDANAVTCKSGLPNEIPDNSSAKSLCRITHLLWTKASRKARQMSEHKCARVLVIACEHSHADSLLDPVGAEWLLTSKTWIPIEPSAAVEEDFNLVTHLENSVFFRFNKETARLESCKRSISVILLLSISDVSASVVGILHPDPVYNFPIELLPSVPFVRLKKWHVENDRLSTEWVIHKQTNANTTTEQVLDEPRPMLFYYDEKFR